MVSYNNLVVSVAYKTSMCINMVTFQVDTNVSKEEYSVENTCLVTYLLLFS